MYGKTEERHKPAYTPNLHIESVLSRFIKDFTFRAQRRSRQLHHIAERSSKHECTPASWPGHPLRYLRSGFRFARTSQARLASSPGRKALSDSDTASREARTSREPPGAS